MTISDLARAKGVSKQAISKRVDRFAQAGALATRKGARGAVMVNVAAYDRAAGEIGDAIRELAQRPATSATIGEESDGTSPVLAREQARRMSYQADLAEMELDERRGKLLRRDDVEAAMVRCGEIMVRALEQFPSRADELATAVARDGEQGARMFLKGLARDLRALIARELRLLERAPGETPAEEDEDEE